MSATPRTPRQLFAAAALSLLATGATAADDDKIVYERTVRRPDSGTTYFARMANGDTVATHGPSISGGRCQWSSVTGTTLADGNRRRFTTTAVQIFNQSSGTVSRGDAVVAGINSIFNTDSGYFSSNVDKVIHLEQANGRYVLKNGNENLSGAGLTTGKTLGARERDISAATALAEGVASACRNGIRLVDAPDDQKIDRDLNSPEAVEQLRAETVRRLTTYNFRGTCSVDITEEGQRFSVGINGGTPKDAPVTVLTTSNGGLTEKITLDPSAFTAIPSRTDLIFRVAAEARQMCGP